MAFEVKYAAGCIMELVLPYSCYISGKTNNLGTANSYVWIFVSLKTWSEGNGLSINHFSFLFDCQTLSSGSTICVPARISITPP